MEKLGGCSGFDDRAHHCRPCNRPGGGSFPDANPVGAKIPFGERSLTIVGVFEQARLYDVHQDGRPQILVRAEDWGIRPLFYVIRTGRDPRALIPEVRAAVRHVDVS